MGYYRELAMTYGQYIIKAAKVTLTGMKKYGVALSFSKVAT